jgi:hypothetical protein
MLSTVYNLHTCFNDAPFLINIMEFCLIFIRVIIVDQYRPECNQNLSTRNKTCTGITSPLCIPFIQFLWKGHTIHSCNRCSCYRILSVVTEMHFKSNVPSPRYRPVSVMNFTVPQVGVIQWSGRTDHRIVLPLLRCSW